MVRQLLDGTESSLTAPNLADNEAENIIKIVQHWKKYIAGFPSGSNSENVTESYGGIRVPH